MQPNKPMFDNNLISWYLHINYGMLKPLRWQQPLFKVLHHAMTGKCSKILISAPPQHGKTMLTIEAFASLYMCNNPDDKVIVTAYSQQRATKYGLRLRNIINHFGKDTMFRPRLSQDQQSKTNFIFDYPHTGELLAAGSHGAIMGNPANLIIIDDPVKELKDATSVILQESLEDWYIGSVNTRLRKNDINRNPILIVVAQRLNQKDLHGILQDKYDILDGVNAMNKIESRETIPKDTMINLNFPALSLGSEQDILGRPKDTPLWENHKSKQDLLNDKKMMGEYRFQTIMQGNPVEYKDFLFTNEMFYNPDGSLNCTVDYLDVPSVPMGRFWDTAASSKKAKKNVGDYFVGSMCGYDYWNTETMYIFNMIRGKNKAMNVVNTIRKAIIDDGYDKFTYIQQEPGSMSLLFLSIMEEQFQNYDVMYSKAEHNKLYNTVELQTLASEGRLKFVTYPGQDNSWIDVAIHELTNFDGSDSNSSKGKHDDIPDSFSMAANYFMQNRNLYTYNYR